MCGSDCKRVDIRIPDESLVYWQAMVRAEALEAGNSNEDLVEFSDELQTVIRTKGWIEQAHRARDAAARIQEAVPRPRSPDAEPEVKVEEETFGGVTLRDGSSETEEGEGGAKRQRKGETSAAPIAVPDGLVAHGNKSYRYMEATATQPRGVLIVVEAEEPNAPGSSFFLPLKDGEDFETFLAQKMKPAVRSFASPDV